MYKIGLKLWNLNIDNYLPIAKELYFDNIFDYIELYIVPGHIDKIHHWKNLNIPIDLHAPHSAHGMNLSSHKKFETNKLLYNEVKAYANILNARYIILHGGTNGDYFEVANQIKSFNDNRILIENKPYKPLEFINAKEYTGCKPEEIKYIITNSNVGFCLDIGHSICAANSFNIDLYQYISQFAQLNPLKIHLSDLDIFSEKDMHLNFGDGNLDFYKIKNILKQVNDITIETNKKSQTNLNDFVNDVTYIRKILNE